MHRLCRGARERLLAAAFATLCWGLLPRPAQANDFEAFERARMTYERGDYAGAAELFDELVGGQVPRLTNRSLVLESLKYLGASRLFLGELAAAEQDFARLLRMDPEYLLDPLAFPDEVQRLFTRVKNRLELEREAAEAARREQEERELAEQAERERREKQRWQRLSELAKTEQVHEVRSRWLAMVPFGVGQFHNGHEGLGLVLAVSEASLLAIAITSYVLHEDLRGQTPASRQLDDARLAERAFRYTNQISFGLFSVLAITGVIDAQIRFAGTRRYERTRPLPPDLHGGPELGIGPGGATLKLRF